MTGEEKSWQKISANVDRWYAMLGHATQVTPYRKPTKFRSERGKARHLENIREAGRRMVFNFGETSSLSELARKCLLNEQQRDQRDGNVENFKRREARG